MAIKSFEIVSVPVSDQQRSKQFYRDVVGLELVREEPMGPGQSWIQLAPKGCLTSPTSSGTTRSCADEG
jgi:catechol 2,3-dioxygenase-like lactoylglutathione lyase family enzyme